MHIFHWLVRIALFMALFMLAVINTDPVVIRYFPGHGWQVPLALMLFVVFSGGTLIGVVSGIAVVARQRHEILGLRRALRRVRGDVAA